MNGNEWSRGFRMLLLTLLFVLAALIALARMTSFSADPDMFWHVETGRWIVEHRAIPHTDVFSWYGVEAGLPWTPHEWLWDVGAFGLFAWGGYAALYGATAALFGILALVCFWWLRIRTQDDLRSLALTMVIVVGTATFAVPRPQVLTFVLLVAMCASLERKWYFVAPLVMLLIANTHGATYPLFLFVIALYTLPHQPLWFALSAAGVFAQPLGLPLLAYPFGGSSPATSLLLEWTPTVPAEQPTMFLAAAALAVLVRWKDVRWRDGVLAAAVTILSMMAVRHVAFFLLLAVPALAPYLPPPTHPAEGRPQLRLNLLLATVLAVGCLAMGVVVVAEPMDVDRGYPREAAAYLEDQGITRIWNEWGEGGYLIAHGVAPFVDGRADPFFSKKADQGQFVVDYMETLLLDRDIRPFLRRQRISYLLVTKERDLSRLLDQSQSFEKVQEWPTHALYRFSDSPQAASEGTPTLTP